MDERRTVRSQGPRLHVELDALRESAGVGDLIGEVMGFFLIRSVEAALDPAELHGLEAIAVDLLSLGQPERQQAGEQQTQNARAAGQTPACHGPMSLRWMGRVRS